MSTRFGTRKAPTRLRLLLIGVVVFVLALVFLSLDTSNANALPPPNGCTRDGEPIDCRDRFESGPFSRENSERTQKYLGTVVIGCAGGFAAGSGPGAIYGCTAAAMASAWDWYFAD